MSSLPLRLNILATFAIAFVLGGCSILSSPGNCDVPADDEVANAPKLLDFDIRQDPEASDPWEVVFIVGFEDADGNLGGMGELILYPGGEPEVVPLANIFEQSGLDLDASSGTFAFPLRFGESIDDGSRVSIDGQLMDQAGNHSNCYRLNLNFDIEAL